MKILDLGIKGFSETLVLQKELLESRAKNEIEDTLILVEHPNVITAGRSVKAEELAAKKASDKDLSIVETERGGRFTFHGPGQLVGYPIFKITNQDLRHYLRTIESILISVLTQETGLPVKPVPETLTLEPGQLQTGVWFQDKKIASIGIAIKHWVSYHGFAINFTTDLKQFAAIEPCGFSPTVMSSIEQELSKPPFSFLHFQRNSTKEILKNVKIEIAKKFEELSQFYAQFEEEKSLGTKNSHGTFVVPIALEGADLPSNSIGSIDAIL